MADNAKESTVNEIAMTTIASTDTKATVLSTVQLETETLKSQIPGQIPLSELEIGKEIGQGTYGRVCVGKWKKYRVALKFCQNRGKMDEFMREANLMITLPPPPNVVRMYGISLDGTQPIIVMEYCAGGSLDKLLYDTKEQISMEEKVKWIHEVAQGMLHLHKYNIVHRDLAARNILLTSSDPTTAQLKISDFGMSRVLQEDIENKTVSSVGPVCWMAPESLRHKVYSKKSDVWMFGVVVYEIVAQREPHADIDTKNVTVLIRDKGLTPTIPNDCPEKLRQVMQLCWNIEPQQRPNFQEICRLLESERRHSESSSSSSVPLAVPSLPSPKGVPKTSSKKSFKPVQRSVSPVPRNPKSSSKPPAISASPQRPLPKLPPTSPPIVHN